jgi:hypothetical protein
VSCPGDRFIFKHVHCCGAWATGFESLDQRSFGDDLGAAGVDDQRAGFHAREVLSCDDAARLGVER